MKSSFRFSLALLCALAAWILPAAAETAVPANLAAPAGHAQTLTLEAKGVQIYEWRAKGDGSGFEWALKAPEAELLDAAGKKVGRHYAGPTWELNDGGKVAAKVKVRSDAPNGAGNIPWLLLEVTEGSATGSLGKVRFIQRLNTVGGVAPAPPADAGRAGQEARVNYTATYRFFSAK